MAEESVDLTLVRKDNNIKLIKLEIEYEAVFGSRYIGSIVVQQNRHRFNLNVGDEECRDLLLDIHDRLEALIEQKINGAVKQPVVILRLDNQR